MATSERQNRSRVEVNHSIISHANHNVENNTNEQQQLQRSSIFPLDIKLNIESHSEPIPQSRNSTLSIFPHTENTENIPPPTMFKMPMENNHDYKMQITDDRSDELLTHHRLHDDHDIANDTDSEPEPSPTPIVSDLDDIPAFPVHGISIPYYNEDDEDSETPEPLDTPLTPGHDLQYNYNHIPPSDINDDDAKDILLSDIDIDLDHDGTDGVESEDLPPIKPRLRLSKSEQLQWQNKTMTRRNYTRSQCIKCITPITQEMAVRKIKDFSTRRHSVANITPSVHKLFILDPDLMKIRNEFLERLKSQNSDNDSDDGKDELFLIESDHDDMDQINENQMNEMNETNHTHIADDIDATKKSMDL